MIPHDTHLNIGSLLFEGIDQIDLTGPFEVLSRIPNSCLHADDSDLWRRHRPRGASLRRSHVEAIDQVEAASFGQLNLTSCRRIGEGCRLVCYDMKPQCLC
jgi:hypothetical protein